MTKKYLIYNSKSAEGGFLMGVLWGAEQVHAMHPFGLFATD
jgi:hypothetical protein